MWVSELWILYSLNPISLIIYYVLHFFLQLLLHAIDTFNVNVVLVLGQVDFFFSFFSFFFFVWC